MLRLTLLAALLVAAVPFPVAKHDAAVSPEVAGTEHAFDSPGGVSERCVMLHRMPGGVYSDEDAAQERAFCAIDFYADTHALCPKVFSTSPGTLVYDLSAGPHRGDPEGFRRAECKAGGISSAANGPPVSFKMSVNTRETSATFANAALIYYHFAHYFDASTHVPVAVFRSMDRKEHQERVSAHGVSLSAGSSALRMNHAAWTVLRDAEANPASYRPTEELFTADGQVYGVMLHPRGRRYSEEINGTRASGWGDGQNRDFQETAPFQALRSELPLVEAVAAGKRAAWRDGKLAAATRPDSSLQQMVFWMNDLIDVTLLDYIFSQQDRVGNVDYIAYWYWVENGVVQRREASDRTPPADLAAKGAVFLKRTELGDNDAGVRTSYANFTKRTGMLEKLRHYRADTYERLMRLDADYQAKGPLYEHTRDTFGMNAREFAQTVGNVALAAGILRESCKAGRLRFDVEPMELLLTGTVRERTVECEPR